jgi:hypothetical protein
MYLGVKFKQGRESSEVFYQELLEKNFIRKKDEWLGKKTENQNGIVLINL